MTTTMPGLDDKDVINRTTTTEMEPETPNGGFINDLRDMDVLCGRGGAALRHPGNLTYRRLVNLNKGLYITCLKTEKLKISRSIVAAIREQNGRFLEKDSKSNAYYDIGDKKAIEKTSQALREGQPKLRQQIAEMGTVSVHQHELDLSRRDYDTGDGPYQLQRQQQYAMQQQELMPPPQMPNEMHHQPLLPLQQLQSQLRQQQQQQQQQEQQFVLRQELLQRQHSYDQLLRDTSGHSNRSNHSGGVSSSGGLRRQQEMQAVEPSSPLPHIDGTGNQSLDYHAELLQRLSLRDLQQVAAATGELDQRPSSHLQHQSSSTLSASSQFQQQQQLLMMQQQQQRQQLYEQRNRLRPNLNTRASLARELGIAESQLSLMSEFSAFGGCISTSGLGSVGLPNSSNPMMSAESLTNSINDIQNILSIDSSFKRDLMGLPVGSLHTLQSSDYMSYDNTSMSTGASSMRFGGSSAAAAAAAAAAVNNASNIDRRRVFAKMKYSRPPSVRAAPMGGVSHHGSQSQHSWEEMPDFHMLESNMSLYSNSSNPTGLDARANHSATGVAAAAAAAAACNTSNYSNVLPNSANFQMPTNFNSGNSCGTKVIVETAKVIDHSSHNRSNFFGDAMSGGSRHSIMSGMSRISDSSIDQSLFSDLSRKIGDVSTRSMNMSEISAIDLQERDNEDASSSNDGIVETFLSLEQIRAQQQTMDYDRQPF